MRIAAILWDGSKRIQGNLELTDSNLKFHFLDFSHTDLAFDLILDQIEKIELYSLFNKSEQGIKIISKTKKFNVFIVDSPRLFRKNLLQKIKGIKNKTV